MAHSGNYYHLFVILFHRPSGLYRKNHDYISILMVGKRIWSWKNLNYNYNSKLIKTVHSGECTKGKNFLSSTHSQMASPKQKTACHPTMSQRYVFFPRKINSYHHVFINGVAEIKKNLPFPYGSDSTKQFDSNRHKTRRTKTRTKTHIFSLFSLGFFTQHKCCRSSIHLREL